ncbi:MAG: hypothetical protein ACREMB_18645 [Candidatus Rokuibacteriota bacterium]
MERESFERIARELAAELPLPPEDWDAVLAQARPFLETVAMLDELPLAPVEPAPIFRAAP